MAGIGLGTLLAVIAWLPAAGWLVLRRGAGPDRWFLGAVAWGVVVVAAVLLFAVGSDAGPRERGGPATWLLVGTFVFWLSATFVSTRRRTPR